MQYKKFFVTSKGKEDIKNCRIIYARDEQEARQEAEKRNKKDYTTYWKMKITNIECMGIA